MQDDGDDDKQGHKVALVDLLGHLDDANDTPVVQPTATFAGAANLNAGDRRTCEHSY